MENTIWTLWVDGHRNLFMVTKLQKEKKGDGESWAITKIPRSRPRRVGSQFQ